MYQTNTVTDHWQRKRENTKSRSLKEASRTRTVFCAAFFDVDANVNDGDNNGSYISNSTGLTRGAYCHSSLDYEVIITVQITDKVH